MSGQPVPSRAATTIEGGGTDLRSVISSLSATGRAARRLLLTREIAWLIALGVAATLTLGLADYYARLPWWLRVIGLLIILGVLGARVVRQVLPLWRFRPSLTDLALRLEKTPKGANLRGLLASAIDFSQQPATDDPALTTGAIQEALAAFRSSGGARSLLKPAGVRNRLVIAALCLAPAAAITLWQPDLAAIGTARIFTPWRNIDWPKRYAVTDATDLSAAAIGNSVPLKAVIYRTDRPMGKTNVLVKYRLITGETRGPVERAALTGQGRVISAAISSEENVKGELYERLIDPGAKGESEQPASAAPAVRRALEYWFEADDDQTQARTIELVEPPTVIGASVTIDPPGYAASVAGTESNAIFASGTRDLGPGRDDRATVGPVLAGSNVRVTLNLNKPVTPPPALDSAFPQARLPRNATLTTEEASWLLSFTAEEALRLPVSLVDEYGIRSAADAAYQFQVVPDRAPAAAIVDPAQDESVLATAIINVTGEGRDDVGIASLAVELQLASIPADSAGAPAEAKGERSTLVRTEPSELPQEVRVTMEIELPALNVKPRDEVWLWALAADSYNGGEPREPARSTMRRLRIISEGEFVESIRTELGSLRQSAMRLDQDQADATKRLSQNSTPTDVLRAQEGIAQRLMPLAETLQKLGSRVERNNLADRSLSGLLTDASDSIAGARSGAEAATDELRRAEQQEAEKLGETQRQEVEANQDRTRDELGRLISLLDTGQDAWATRREINRLLEDQRKAMTQTGDLGRQTAGKSSEELSSAERDQAEQLSQQQQELARRSGALMDSLEDRAKKIEKNDPALSQAMKEVAERGSKEQLQNNQRQAGEQIKKNQTGAAQQSQQKAAEALEQMLEELDGAEQNRDRALRAALEDISNSIGELIAEQGRAIDSLSHAIPEASFAGLDRPMISLHGATLALTEKIRSGYRELAPVADHLEGAARAQETAVTILRGAAPDGLEADKAERTSLDRLMQAKAEADRIMNETEDREQERQRADLRKAYREALEKQSTLKTRTDEFIGKQLDRRQRAGVRGLGDQQEEIRVSLSDLRKNTKGLSDAKVFDFAHDRLEGSTSRAAEALRAGNVALTVERDQASAVRVLRSLVEALKDGKGGDFEKGASGSGSSGSGSSGAGQEEPLVPPIAELRLLKGFQEDAAELTRLVHENPDRFGEQGIKDAAELQEKLTEHAQDLIERSSNNDVPQAEEVGKKSPEFGYPLPLPPDWKPPAEREPDKPKDDSGLDSLDELLGLPSEKGAEGEKPAPDGELERALSPSEIADEFAKTVELMKQASNRLESARDTGLTTQRMQEDIAKRLDQIISAAERNSQQRMSQQKQKQQPQSGQQRPQPQQSQANSAKNENRGQVDPPARQDGQLTPVQPAPGSTWGNLPEHVRDSLMQGRSDRFSSLYQTLTEAYYRRLAEQAKPIAPKEPR